MSETEINSAERSHAIKLTYLDKSVQAPVMFLWMSSIVWLIGGILLGLVYSIKLYSPDFLTSSFPALVTGRVFTAHINVLVYGFALQALLGVALWVGVRLSQAKLTQSGMVVFATLLWNLVLTGGIKAILEGNGKGVLLLDIPQGYSVALLALYIVFVFGIIVRLLSSKAAQGSIASHFLAYGLIAFPWIAIIAYNLVFSIPGAHPLMTTAVAEWFQSALIYMFIVPVVAAGLLYVAPRSVQGVASNNLLIKLSFYGLIILAPCSGFEQLLGSPVPYFLPALSAACGVLLIAALVGIFFEVFGTLSQSAKELANRPSARFLWLGAVSVLVLAGLKLMQTLPLTADLFQFSGLDYFVWVWVALAVVGMSVAGISYFAVPRLTGREWVSKRVVRSHFWTGAYALGTFLMLGLLMAYFYAIAQQNWEVKWTVVNQQFTPVAMVITTGWFFGLLSTVAYALHLFIMWVRLGRLDEEGLSLEQAH